MRLSDESLRGRTVISTDGQVVGDVAAILLDTVSLRVESFQLRLRKEAADRIGADRSVFHAAALEIPSALVQSIGDTILLSVPLDELRRKVPDEVASTEQH